MALSPQQPSSSGYHHIGEGTLPPRGWPTSPSLPDSLAAGTGNPTSQANEDAGPCPGAKGTYVPIPAQAKGPPSRPLVTKGPSCPGDRYFLSPRICRQPYKVAARSDTN